MTDDRIEALRVRATLPTCSQCGAVDPPTERAEWLDGHRFARHVGCPSPDALFASAVAVHGLTRAEQVAVLDALRDRDALLLATAAALKGPPPPLSQHSAHDLPDVAAGLPVDGSPPPRAPPALDLDAIETRWSGATKGPWKATQVAGFGAVTLLVSEHPEAEWHSVVAIVHNAGGRAAAEAMAAARTDVPALVARVRELEAQLAAAQPALALALDAVRRGRFVSTWARCLACDGTGATLDGAPCEPCRGAGHQPPAADRDRCPRCGALDLDHTVEECARRWAEQHPIAAAGIVGATVAPKGYDDGQ